MNQLDRSGICSCINNFTIYLFIYLFLTFPFEFNIILFSHGKISLGLSIRNVHGYSCSQNLWSGILNEEARSKREWVGRVSRKYEWANQFPGTIVA